MKLFVGGLSTETNTFLSMPTGYDDFEQTTLVYGGDPPTGEGMLSFIGKRVQERGWTLVDGLFAGAFPAGPTTRAAYESLRDEILADLRAALPVDMVALFLHGAMVAESYDDCEGDLLARVREIVGPEAPVGALLDPHCHLTQKMVDNATVLIAFKEWPHTDAVERAEEVFDLITAAAEGQVKPVMSVFDCRMICSFPTDKEPMRSFVNRLKALEGQDGVLSISVAHGFAWGDVPGMGAKILVVTDDRPEYGERLAEELGRELFDMRETVDIDYLTIDEALERALEVERSPVVLADAGDCIGGGTPGDATFILQAMLERGVENAAIHNLWDPIAASIAMSAGVGAQLDLRVGGKIGPMSGDPLDLHVKVIEVKPAHTVSAGSFTYSFGDTVVVRVLRPGSGQVRGIDIVLASKREAVFSHECFSAVGIDPRQRHILVVKSAHNFYAGFVDIAAETLHVASPGANTPDVTLLPFEHANINQWPLVEDPFAQ